MISDAAIAEMAAIATAREIPPGTPLSEFDSIFIEHPSYKRAFSKIEDTIKLHGQLTEAPCLQITGVPGIGKSTLCKKIETSYPRVEDGRSFTLSCGVIAKCDHIPVLLVRDARHPHANTADARDTEGTSRSEMGLWNERPHQDPPIPLHPGAGDPYGGNR